MDNLSEKLMQAHGCNNSSVEIQLGFLKYAFDYLARDIPELSSRVNLLIEIAKEKEAA